MATYNEQRLNDEDFEVRKFEICGQDFIADLCGCVDIITPVVAYLVDLQSVHVPVWKAAVWFPKVVADVKELCNLSIDNPPDHCINLKSNIGDIKEFHFNDHELVEGWLVIETDVQQATADKERSEVVTWKMRQLKDVEEDLQQLAKDLSSSLELRHAKCLSTLQHTLSCIDIDSLIELLVGERKSSGYPSLSREDEFVECGRDDFKKFYTYICSLNHVRELAENHFTELKLRPVYCDEVLAKLKNVLKVVMWTPRHVHILSGWLTCVTVGAKGQV